MVWVFDRNREVAAFFDRLRLLRPDVALFVVDTALRLGDKVVPMLGAELGRPPTDASVRRGAGLAQLEHLAEDRPTALGGDLGGALESARQGRRARVVRVVDQPRAAGQLVQQADPGLR